MGESNTGGTGRICDHFSPESHQESQKTAAAPGAFRKSARVAQSNTGAKNGEWINQSDCSGLRAATSVEAPAMEVGPCQCPSPENGAPHSTDPTFALVV